MPIILCLCRVNMCRTQVQMMLGGTWSKSPWQYLLSFGKRGKDCRSHLKTLASSLRVWRCCINCQKLSVSACALLLGLILNLSYPKPLHFTFEVLQKIIMELDQQKMSPKVHNLYGRLQTQQCFDMGHFTIQPLWMLGLCQLQDKNVKIQCCFIYIIT